jgi:Ca-activated chloride channel family protein
MKFWFIFPVALLITSAVAQTDSAPSIKVEVKLVNVFVTVADSVGNPVPTLKQDNFQLFEDGVPQKIAVFARQTDVPLSIIVAVDTSLSTRKDLPFELQSAKRFAHDILDPKKQDALALYQFSTIVQQVVPFTANLREIDHGIDDVTVGAATSLYDAIYDAADGLAARQGRKLMVVITDGGDNGSNVSYADALREAQQAEAVIVPIIIVPIESSAGRNTGGEHALIQLAHDTGGKAYYADSGPQLDEVFHQIATDLATQYLLAYYPSQRIADSDFRRIQIELTPSAATNASSLNLRYRTGYYTSPSK